MSEMFDFKNYQWRKMAKNGEKWRKMAMANLPFSFVKFAISPLAPPPFWYRTCTGIFEGSPVTAVGGKKWWKRWLPHVTDWKTEEFYVAYNVADYRVAKRK